MKKFTFKDESDGIWKNNFEIQNDNFGYQKNLVRYLNKIDPIFHKARDMCEFEFIVTLLRFEGLKEAGWDPFENLEDVYDSFKKLSKRNSGNKAKSQYALFLYGLILEASVPYETFANLLNVIDGDRYKVRNFPDYSHPITERAISQSPLDKISQLESRAKKHKLELDFFAEFFDNKLRNAIFHSDYVIYWPEVRINNPARKYSHDEWMILINSSFAYIDAFLNVHKSYIEEHKEPKLIEPHPGFNYHSGGKMTTITREDHGLIGIRDTWTPEEISLGMIPNHFGKFLPYEISLLENGTLKMPPNKIERFNNKLRYLPTRQRAYLVKRFKKKFNI